MKNLFLLIAVSLIIFSCKKTSVPVPPVVYETLGETYISHRYKDRLTTTQLTARLNSILPNSDSLIHPKYDVIVYRIFYKTHDYKNNEITASGLVYIPEIEDYYVPLVCYQHGTAIQKQEVPSISADMNYYVPFIMASETGTLVCAADYIGLGFSDSSHHFYEPTEEANSVVDMLGSVQILLNKTYRPLRFNSDIFLMGYSQGGHATLAAQRKLEIKYPNQFHIKASAPMASWFALEKSSQLNILKDSVSFSFSGAYAFLINSLQTTQQMYPSYASVFVTPYDSLTNVLFDGTKTIGYVDTKYPDYFYNTLQPSFRNELRNNTNTIFLQAVKNYDIINDWIPKAPTRFYHSINDEIAFYENSEIAYNTFKQKGGNVALINIGNYSHFEGNIIAIEKVRDWFYPLIQITPY
ncbi:MAG TPA: lipase family protein [Chitinophagales bacterium]|nr:lipase family protein [Chitinophagales bacterium]